jgi:hypothetical protein
MRPLYQKPGNTGLLVFYTVYKMQTLELIKM